MITIDEFPVPSAKSRRLRAAQFMHAVRVGMLAKRLRKAPLVSRRARVLGWTIQRYGEADAMAAAVIKAQIAARISCHLAREEAVHA